MRSALLLLMALATAPSAAASEENTPTQLLRHRLELAKGTLPYFQIGPESVVIYLKGIRVKRLPLRGATGLSQSRHRMSKLESLLPVEPVPEIVVRAYKPGFVPTPVSPRDVVGVEDMPDQFLLKLRDGSIIQVRSDTCSGLRYWLRERILRLRLSWSYLGGLLQGNWNASLIQLDMEAYWARRLFWALQKGSGVIY